MQARENLAAESANSAANSAAKSVADALIPSPTDKQKWWQQITEYSLIVIFVVMREGRISGELPRSAASEHAVLDLALPQRAKALAA